MIIIEDFENEFFNKIIGEHLLIIVSSGVDSVCTFKIIKHILKNYNVLFSYAIIRTKSELKTAYSNYGEIKNVLLINYGAIIDIIDFLEIDQNMNKTIYIIDSQRPVHINNFYNQSQVKLLAFKESFDNVPDFDDVFKDEDDDDSETDSEEPSAKRTKLDNIEDKIQSREWKKKREEILTIYEMYCCHGTSSSLVAYLLGMCMNQFSNELLWTAIVGHTSQYILNFINRKSYCDYMDFITSQHDKLKVSRKFNKAKNKEEIFIEEREELNLWLYRHWSLDEALHVTPVTLGTFKLCRVRGLTRLNEFLAFLGIPQQQSKNPFSSMDCKIKKDLFTLFKDHYQRYNLPKEELFLPSFIATCGYRTGLSAMDATFIIVSILEDVNGKDSADKFNSAMNVLSIWDSAQIEWGLNLAKKCLKTIHKQTTDLMETNDVISYGPFLHVELKKSCPPIIHSALVQNIFSRYLLASSFSIRPKLGIGKKAEKSPLILCSQINDDQLVLYGIPPLASDKGRNLFGRIFETILANLNYQVEQDSLDICRVIIHPCDKMKVFDKISQLLMS